MRHSLRHGRSWFFLILASGLCFAQTERFIPDSASAANLWRISDSTKLYVGASFFYTNSQDSIVVWLDSSDADTAGILYFMVPGYQDSALRLFTNRQNNARTNITKALGKPVPVGTEIFFLYQNMGRKFPRYTGQNRVNIDPQNQSAYPGGANFVSRDFGLRPGYGHRFAVAGRLAPVGGVINDTIVFGFEDGGDTIIPGHDSLVVSDFDFNDIIFKTTGLALNIEAIPDSIGIVCRDTASAGDSILCKPEVWSDSGGIKVRSPQFDSLVTWRLTGNALLGDVIIPAQIGSVVFLARTAFEKFTVCASLSKVTKKDTLRSCKTIPVLPGRPQLLSIELRSDSTSPNFSLHSVVQIMRVQVLSNQNTLSLYAVMRDRFGNFAGFSSSAVWDTSSASTLPEIKAGVARVRPGNAARGEGIVEKVAGSGSVLMMVKTGIGADTLRDTAIVNIAAADYDSVRVCVAVENVLSAIRSCKLSNDQCSTFVSMGRRVDNGTWERIETQWQPRPWYPIATSARDSIHFCPNDTGVGSITVIYQNRLTASIPVTVSSGIPAALVCYTETGVPFPFDTFAIAGTALKINARIFDKHGIKLTIPDSILTWKIVENSTIPSASDSSGHLTINTGNPVSYFPRRARRELSIRAAYQGLSDTLSLSIRPGKPFRISIEPDADWQSSPYAVNAIDTILVPDDRTSAIVWALVRDSLGNYVDSLQNGLWGSTDSIVSVQSGSRPGQAVVAKDLKVSRGTCAIFVSKPSSSLIPDSAYVTLLPYHYVALRIVTGNNIPIDSLLMTTNDDTTLHAQALRSDTALWPEVSARWTVPDSMTDPPAKGPLLRFSPLRPGRGAITAVLGETQTFSDTVRAVITPGDPVRAEFSIITPDEARVAGDTMRAVVRIYNKDGLVPGPFCYGKGSAFPPAYYQDSLGNENPAFIPKVLSVSGETDISIVPSLSAGMDQCFNDGSDTIRLILYYAPFDDDSLHCLAVKLGGVSANCVPFHLRPSKLSTLKVSHSNYCCGDTLVLRSPSESAVVYVVGYDKFGNVRGEENCTWKTTGTLHAIDVSAPVSRIVYGADSQSVKRDQEGALIATSSVDTTVSGSLWTLLLGPQAMAMSALTNDDDGNGLLDRITVRFSGPVYKRDPGLCSRFSAVHEGTSLETDSAAIASDSLSMDLFLKEKLTGSLQTGWTPYVLFHNNGFALGGATDSFSIKADDGAGPVIDSVVREITNSDRRNDLVTVIFSEPVVGKDGNTISFVTTPGSLFSTWTNPVAGSFDSLNLLDGISGLIAPTELVRVRFNTSNGKELLSSHYFSLRNGDGAIFLSDKSGNRPSPLNRKVNVTIKGEPPAILVVAPNPGVPTTRRERPGEFHFAHNPSALQWVGNDRAGFVLKFQVLIPKDPTARISGRIKIYDAVGNNVAGDPVATYQLKNIVKRGRILNNENLQNVLPSNWTPDGTVYDFIVYWNGYSKAGRKVAAGVYKVIATIFTETSGGKEEKTLTRIMGIK